MEKPKKQDFYEKLSEDQKQRIEDHQASVTIVDGKFRVTSETLVVPGGGGERKIKTMAVIPSSSERVAPMAEYPELFSDLKHMNVILTNACNLSCTYCYEQHKKDYGRFTVEKLKKFYDFHLSCNQHGQKVFQFFGGEPLIHKALILSFLQQHGEELAKNAHKLTVSINTNGTLLSREFLDEYFKADFTGINISLDTLDVSIDRRELAQEKINHILSMVSHVPQSVKDAKRLSIRCTISVETARRLDSFIDELYQRGVRTMVVHPLTMSSLEGFIRWQPEQWEKLHDDIDAALEKYSDFSIQFSEGVGFKHENNCMIGSDMIAVDASGDFSGCYFFTNQKENAGHTMLGNILDGVVYLDRYTEFKKSFAQMFEHEQCKSCNFQNLCYQCPAGNLDTGGKLFRPDDMCQKIVKLFLDLQADRNKKQFFKKFNNLLAYVEEKGEQFAFKKSILALMYRKINDEFFRDPSVFEQQIEAMPDYEEMLAVFAGHIESGSTGVLPPLKDAATIFAAHKGRTSIKDFYELLTEKRQLAIKKSGPDLDDVNKRVFYLTLVHLLILGKQEARPI